MLHVLVVLSEIINNDNIVLIVLIVFIVLK